MSGLRLCRVPLAEKPFYIECIGTNAFSIEEICYFMYHHPALLYTSIINRDLCEWFMNELHLARLGQSMERVLDENRSLVSFVMPVFREISYLSREEAEDFSNRLTALTIDSVAVRLKKKGDALVSCGKISGAIHSYHQILDSDDKSLKPPFLTSVWHNLGVANMKMLLYNEGLACFEKEYMQSHTGNSLKSYLFAFAICKPREKYEAKLAELKVDEETASKISRELADASVFEESAISDVDAYLVKLTKDYHYATDS